LHIDDCSLIKFDAAALKLLLVKCLSLTYLAFDEWLYQDDKNMQLQNNDFCAMFVNQTNILKHLSIGYNNHLDNYTVVFIIRCCPNLERFGWLESCETVNLDEVKRYCEKNDLKVKFG